MDIDLRDFDDVHLLGKSATYLSAPRLPCHVALLVLAGMNLPRSRPCRARSSQMLGLFVPSKGAQAPLEPYCPRIVLISSARLNAQRRAQEPALARPAGRFCLVPI